MLKVFEAFAGIGTQRMALRNLHIEHEVVAIAEIDKFAIKSYEAIHGEVNNVGDISKVDIEDIPDHDLFTYSFPCQDISIAGRKEGLAKDSGTRSSLLWECNRVIENKKPKYLMLENVKNLVGTQFKPDFDEWLNHLEGLGYTNYWQVLNAKDYGVPQNRERVFVVSVLGEHKPYVFPEKFELTSRLKDVLEDEVEEKFYLSDKQMEKLAWKTGATESEIKKLAHRKGYNDNSVVHDPEGINSALTTMGGGGREPHVLLKSETVSFNRKDGVGNEIDVAHTLLARDYKGFGNQDMSAVVEPFRIRRLTPKECWRLMGCSDEDFHKAEEVNSTSQLYKQAGNAIVVDVLEQLLGQLFR